MSVFPRFSRCVNGRIFATLAITLAMVFLPIVFSFPALSSIIGGARAGAQADLITLRIATLAPRGSTWHRVFTAWGNTLRARTEGRLTIQVQPAGPGDELTLVRRLRARDLDGASLTGIGLGEFARPLLVLQAPGVVETHEQLDRARTALDSEIRAQLEASGVVLAGWGDFGRGRIFSTRPIRRPSDLRETRPWVLAGDPIFPEFLRVVGTQQSVMLSIAEVAGALEAGRIDTVVASPTAVTALQWHTRLSHMTQQANAMLLGATLLSKERIDALEPDLRAALQETAVQAHDTLQRTIRRDDERYFQMLAGRMQVVDASAHEAEWSQVAQQTRERLVGRLYSREQLERAMTAARGP